MKEKKLGLLLILDVSLLSLYIGIHYELLNIESLKKFIVSYGAISPIVYMLVMALTIVVSPIPSMPLAATSGVLFGPFFGAFYSVIGGTIGAVIAFYIARVFGRGFIEKILKGHIDFCDSYTGKYIAYFVFFSRMLPVFQFDVISYGAGLTNITLKKFAAATFFGMIPMTLLFAYYGRVIFSGNSFSVVFSTLVIAAVFLVPVIVKKYNTAR